MTLHLLEPELEELLQAIAADPRSSLLKVDRPAIAKGPFDQDVMVRPSATGLTAAERHLLRAHRSELAQWLRRLVFEKLYQRSPQTYCLDLGDGRHLERNPDSESRGAVLHLSDRMHAPSVHTMLRGSMKSRAVVDYAILSCRMWPCTMSYLHLSDAYEAQGDHSLERRALGSAHQLQATREDRAYSFSYVGYALMLKQEYRKAALAYRASCLTGIGWPNEALSMLALSAQCGDERLLEESQEIIHQHPVDEDTLSEWTRDQVTLRSNGVWTPTSESRSLAIKRGESVNDQAHHVLTSLFKN